MEVKTGKRKLRVAEHLAASFVRLHILHGNHGVKNDINVLIVAKLVNGSVGHIEGAFVIVIQISAWINVTELPTITRLKLVQGCACEGLGTEASERCATRAGRVRC